MMSYSDMKPCALANGRDVGMMCQDTGQLSLAVTSLLQCVWFLAVNFTYHSVKVLSLPPSASASSGAYLLLQQFVPSCR